MDLLRRRADLIALHLLTERVPESPWSPEHPAMRLKLASGEAPLSERPIAFLCDDEVAVVGECVTKVVAGLRLFAERAGKQAALYNGRSAREPVVAHALKKIGQLLERPPQDEIRVPQQVWNAYLFGLGEVGVNVILTDGAD